MRGELKESSVHIVVVCLRSGSGKAQNPFFPVSNLSHRIVLIVGRLAFVFDKIACVGCAMAFCILPPALILMLNYDGLRYDGSGQPTKPSGRRLALRGCPERGQDPWILTEE